MTVLWFTLILVFIFAFFSRYFATTVSNKGVNLSYSIAIPNKLMKLGVVLVLVLVSGLRNNIGDTYFYKYAFEIGDFSWSSVLENKEPGFIILQMFLKQISADPQILIFVTALITNLLIVITLYKYSRLIELSIYVFITSGIFTVSMNGIRQSLAASIIFLATKYLLDGSTKKYFITVLFASTIHQSAFILLPIYFIVRREAWTKITFLLLTSSVFIVIGFNQFTELLFSVLDSSNYGNYSDFQEGGASFVRVAVNCAPLILAFLGRKKLHELWPKSDYIVNMSIISTLFMIISTQNWIFARFNIYFGLYNLILISWLVMLFKDNSKKFIYYSILIFYLIYYFYEHVITLNIEYISDYINI